MKRIIEVSIYLDTRRKKKNGRFPVKLRVYNRQDFSRSYFPLQYDYTEAEFDSVWNTIKPRTEHKPDRIRLQAILAKANDIVAALQPFNIELFEKKMFGVEGTGTDACFHYEDLINDYKESKQLGTANSYEYSMKSLKEYIKYVKGKEAKQIQFSEITPKFLDAYERYMIHHKDRSSSTVGIYLRPLRAVFNKAIKEKEISPDLYPFGKGKYIIPSAKGVKKALQTADLKKLIQASTDNPYQQKAKDFWFFSYGCNGMNPKDIATLRYKQISGDVLTFYRAKTIRTSKADARPIIAYLNTYALEVIEKYGNPQKHPENLVFDIINDKATDFENYRRIKNFSKFINQHIKKLAKANGITTELSSYWARHSFTTQSINKGASKEFVQEALGHGSIRTTEAYFGGFEDKIKREFMKGIMDFDEG